MVPNRITSREARAAPPSAPRGCSACWPSFARGWPSRWRRRERRAEAAVALAFLAVAVPMALLSPRPGQSFVARGRLCSWPSTPSPRGSSSTSGPDTACRPSSRSSRCSTRSRRLGPAAGRRRVGGGQAALVLGRLAPSRLGDRGRRQRLACGRARGCVLGRRASGAPRWGDGRDPPRGAARPTSSATSRPAPRASGCAWARCRGCRSACSGAVYLVRSVPEPDRPRRSPSWPTATRWRPR